MSVTYEESEEESEGVETTRIEGDDHYARFYRALRAKFSWLRPKDFAEALERVDSVFDKDYEIDEFFETLCEYIAEEVSKLIPTEGKYIVVDYDYYHMRAEDGIEPYKYTDIIAYVKWNLGGKERYIEVYKKEIAEELGIVDTREDFNSLVDEIVKKIAAEASAVVKSLQKTST